jgi:maleate isomerase
MKDDRPPRIRLGMITPSSNTVLEPMCAAMLTGLSDVTAHFARLRVTRIALDRASAEQFDTAPMQDAASLLADAHVHSLCWNGTSASWLGLGQDEAICAAITERTGVPATSASLATAELLRRARVTRFGLVTPYTGDVQARIVATFAELGFTCVAERHAGIAENYAFATLDEAALGAMVREVAAAGPQAISILCTNLRGAAIAAALEAELGVLMLDSTACALWGSLRAAGVAPSRVSGWGSLFVL